MEAVLGGALPAERLPGDGEQASFYRLETRAGLRHLGAGVGPVARGETGVQLDDVAAGECVAISVRPT